MSGPIVVVGDALLDIDLVGQSSRLCPDAPVPVVEDVEELARPGGAALAASMLADTGDDVVLVAPVADDEAGHRLRALVGSRLQLVAIPAQGATPVKKRIRVNGQSVARIDSGGLVRRPHDELPADVADALASARGVLVADYGQGVTSDRTVRDALETLDAHVPLVWDPHPKGAIPLPTARLVTPNGAEAARSATAAGCDAAGDSLAAVGARADALVQCWSVGAVAVTLGTRGALLSYGSGAPLLVPAPPVLGGDACGAGDRFAAAAAALLADGRVVSEAVAGAVATASQFVAAGGAGVWTTPERPPAREEAPRDASQVTASEVTASEVIATVRARGGTVVATGGCFDLLHAGHVATLEAARRLGDCLVVCLNSDESVRRLKGPQRPLVPAADRARVLAALECVDAVAVFDEDTPEQVLGRLQPDVWAKGGDYAGVDLPEAAVLRRWGGQAVVLPYLEGRSTTAMVLTAKQHG